ncbi:hypothetical protein EV193_104253 [Herbihabitans rhizosphaerae]|uniref:Uncharacterized protein n=1 Tax=Herbihabitans rhizosphaerae TaxID=1872711 RepID=A0A4Q7KU96_9PSEU|nr:hypothetical protein [Herbihabitans rhizosphaerae]RZS39042.1 hypothetical protein EV193_104253 [Herbihabitans rhizosphaerae]
MAESRLADVAPELAGALIRADDRRRAAAVHAACAEALRQADLRDARTDRVVAALAADETVGAQEVSHLVDELDEAAWDLQDAVEQGIAEQSAYLAAFARARAASALAFAADAGSAHESACEAVYEALHAVTDTDQLHDAVAAALASPGEQQAE